MEIAFVAFCGIFFALLAGVITSKQGKKTPTYWMTHLSLWEFGTFAFLAANFGVVSAIDENPMYDAITIFCAVCVATPAAIILGITKLITAEPIRPPQK